MDQLFPLAVPGLLRDIDDLAFHAEVPSSDPPTDDWARGYRDKINGGTAGALSWLHQRKGRPWPPQAPMTAAELENALRRLASDALHLTTVLQSDDCWGTRFSSWPSAADRELVDRVRSRATAIGDLVELLRIPVVEAAPVDTVAQSPAIEQDTETRWSKADRPSAWAGLYGVDVRTFSRWINADPPKIRVKVIDSKNIMVDLRDMPTRNR